MKLEKVDESWNFTTGVGGGEDLMPIDKKKEHCRWNVNFTSEREWLMSKTQARSQKHYHYLQANYQ